ncbi:MAG: hypothetical protein U0230_06260 [Polyangiales bacterium]
MTETTSHPPDFRRAGEPRPVRLAIALVLLVLAGYLGAFVYCATLRFPFPFDLEWMEGGMITHAARLLRGEPIYARPSSDFVAFFYTPIYSRVLAALGALAGGLSFPLGRSISLVATLATFAMLFHAGRREAGIRGGLVAVGLYAALYRTNGTFYDLARADALALALGLAATLVAYEARSTRGAVASALLFVLAFFTKQTSAILAPFVGLYLLTVNVRRALVFGIVGATAGFAVGELEDVLSRGWFRFYILEGHQGHLFYVRNFVLEYWRDLLFLCPTLVLVPTLGASFGRRTRFVALAFGALLVAAFVQRVQTLDFPPHMYFSELWYESPRWRLLVPPIAIVSLLGLTRALGRGMDLPSPYFLFLAVGGALASDLNHSTQWAYSNCFIPVAAYASLYTGIVIAKVAEQAAMSEGAARFAALPAAMAMLVQLAALAYDPRAQTPTEADYRAERRFEEQLSRYPGPVFVPAHPLYAYRRDGTVHVHQMGISDVAFAGGLRDLPYRLERGHFPTVVTDTGCVVPDLDDWYVPVARFEYEGRELYSRTGFAVRPDILWVHRDVYARRTDRRR